MKYLFPTILIFALFCANAEAQEPQDTARIVNPSAGAPQNGAESAKPPQTDAQPQTDAPAEALPAFSAPTQRRARRTLSNREFSDHDKIVLLLNAHCDFPSKDDLLSTSSEAEKHLIDIISDKSLLVSVRMRAVEALSYFNSAMNQKMLEDILANPEKSEHPLMVVQAIYAYARMTPELAPERLEPFLSHSNDFVRFVAISSISRCPGQNAVNVLQKRHSMEKNRYFQMRIQQAISNHCKGPDYCAR